MRTEEQVSNRLVSKYGPTFRRKLRMYRTAYWHGQPVKICEVDDRTLDALVKDAAGKHHNCSVNDLDGFVL